MKIHKIDIKNFKCFVEKSFTFDEAFTVIIGENGKGKTAILDAISVALGAYLLGIDEARPKRHIRFDEIRVKDFGTHPARQTPVEIWADGEIDNEKNLKWGRILTKDRTTTKGTLDEIAKQHQISVNQKGVRVDLPVFSYYSTDRLSSGTKPRLKTKGKVPILGEAYYACLDSKPTPTAPLEWFYGLEMIALQGGNKIFLEQARKTISTCMENWHEVYFDVKENDLVGTRYLPNNKQEKIPFHYLSTGQKAIVHLVTDLAYRCTTLNGHLGERAIIASKGVVLIDEIDLHLHPCWQKRIVGDLKRAFPNIQFIATTHSPFIVQSLSTNEKINLGNIEDGLDSDPFKHSIEDIAEFEMGVEMPQRSQKFLEMERVASEYFALIAQGKTSQTDKKVAQLRQRLNELENFYSDDPAFVAFLKAERKSQTL